MMNLYRFENTLRIMALSAWFGELRAKFEAEIGAGHVRGGIIFHPPTSPLNRGVGWLCET